MDLGATAAKAAVLEIRKGRAAIAQSVSIPMTPELRGDPRALARMLRRELDRAGIPRRDVRLAVDGKESILRYSEVPELTPERFESVMRYEIDAIAERMGERVVGDFALLPQRREGGEGRTAILALAREAPLVRLIDALEAEGLDVALAVPAPLALYAAWDLFGSKAPPDAPEDDLVLLADLGASALNMVLVLNNRLAFARSVSFGGENFTAALAENLGLETEQAERLKTAYGGLKESIPGVNPSTVGPLRGAAGQLVGLLESSLKFCRSQTGVALPARPTRLWLTGGGMRLRGLPEYIAQGLGASHWERFDPAPPQGRAQGDAPPSLTLSLGLSSTASYRKDASRSAVLLNLLPAPHKKRRTFRERTRFLYAAGACLALVFAIDLSAALLRRSASASAVTALEAKAQELREFQQRMEESIAEGRRLKARVAFLLNEAEPTPFQAFLFDFFGSKARAEVQLTSFSLRTEDSREGLRRHIAEIHGRIRNESRQGRDWFRELRSQLLAEERVGRVDVRRAEPEGLWYVFEIAVESRVRVW